MYVYLLWEGYFYIGQRTTFHNNQKGLKKYATREEWKKLISQGWRRTELDWAKKKN